MYAVDVINLQTFRALNLHVDEDGYLTDPDQWSREVASRVADAAGIGQLEPRHWRMIAFMRETYDEFGAPPSQHQLCHHLALDKHAVAEAFGSCRNLWQIAGLPNPGEEMRTYLE